MIDIPLNDEQSTAILVEGLNRGLYENGGKVPDNPEVRLKDATDLVSAAEAASRNGNKSDNVETILFIAQVDQKPNLSDREQQIAQAVSNNDTIECEKRDTVSTNMHNGLDLAVLSNGVIEGLIIGLDKYPNSEQVEVDRKAFIGERERRKNAQAQKGQEISQAEASGEAAEKAREITTESPTPTSAVGNEVSPAGSGAEESFSSPGDTPAGDHAEGTRIESQGEDAGAFARTQTSEASGKGRKVKAKSIGEDSERSKLIEQLTLPVVKAHGVDITKIDSLSSEELKYIIEHPTGPESTMTVNDKEVEENSQTNKELKEGRATVGIETNVEVEEKVISKKDLGIEVGTENYEEASGRISEDREKLESLVTGPMLKAYARGRKEIPSIGDNELRFMILNPDGKVTPDELEKARQLDSDIDDNEEPLLITKAELLDPNLEPPKMVVHKEILGPEIVSHFIDPQDETQDNQGDVNQIIAVGHVNKWSDIRDKNIPRKTIAQSRAMEIIARESMPIPPDYADEEAPILPMDVSVISRDELFSLHAKFHAYEIRMNYVLMEHEDLMNDCIKLREYREAEVAKSVPFMGEDGKRNTNEFRDAQVKGDKEVLELGMKEHEAKKIVTDLKVLRNSYHLDCERLSRQMSKYERERLDEPR